MIYSDNNKKKMIVTCSLSFNVIMRSSPLHLEKKKMANKLWVKTDRGKWRARIVFFPCPSMHRDSRACASHGELNGGNSWGWRWTHSVGLFWSFDPRITGAASSNVDVIKFLAITSMARLGVNAMRATPFSWHRGASGRHVQKPVAHATRRPASTGSLASATFYAHRTRLKTAPGSKPPTPLIAHRPGASTATSSIPCWPGGSLPAQPRAQATKLANQLW